MAAQMIEINRITDVLNHIEGLKAVVFDLDDTLYGEKEYIRSGYSVVAEVIPQVENAERKLWQAFLKKKPAIDEVLSLEGIYTEENRKRCLMAYRSHKPDVHLYDGVMEVLSKIRSNGYKLGIITDGRPEGQRAKIQVLGLERYVDNIIVTDELGGVKYRKPNEAAFIQMADGLNVAFTQMCYVGDNIKKDFIAPQKLGIRSVWFRNKDGLY